MTRRQAEFILCILLWTVAFILWTQTQDLRSRSTLFPTILLSVMSILTGVVFVQNIISVIKEKSASPKLMTRSTFFNIFAVIAASMIYVTLIPVIGFYLLSAVFLTLLYFALGASYSLKKLFKSAIGGVLITTVIFFVFGYLLNVRTPSGMFF